MPIRLALGREFAPGRDGRAELAQMALVRYPFPIIFLLF